MGHLEGDFTPVLYMGRKVLKGQHQEECHSSDPSAYSEVLIQEIFDKLLNIYIYMTRALFF